MNSFLLLYDVFLFVSLEEIEDTKKIFRNYLTFSLKKPLTDRPGGNSSRPNGLKLPSSNQKDPGLIPGEAFCLFFFKSIFIQRSQNIRPNMRVLLECGYYSREGLI